MTYTGIKYKVGDLKKQKQVKINIAGFYYNKLFAKDYFEGSVKIENKSYPSLKLLIGEQLQMVSYRDYDDGSKLNTYGEIFMEKNIKHLTICVAGQKGWNSENGFMVSAPAKNRNEALKISNRLMKNVLIYRLK